MPKAFTTSFARMAASLFQLLMRSMSVPTSATGTTVPVRMDDGGHRLRNAGISDRLTPMAGAQFCAKTALPRSTSAPLNGAGTPGNGNAYGAAATSRHFSGTVQSAAIPGFFGGAAVE